MNTTINPDRLAQLDAITLASGSHDNPDVGLCAMEAVAWLAGQGHTDHPRCASPVLGAMCRSLNDKWDTLTVTGYHEDKPRTVPPITSDRLAAIACHAAESDNSTREIRIGYLAELLARVPAPIPGFAQHTAQAQAIVDAEL